VITLQHRKFMPAQVSQFDATRPFTRACMLLAVILALLGSWFAVRWYIGNTLAEYHNPQVHGIDMGRRAVAWTPQNPMAHWRLGEIAERKLPPDQLAQVVNEYERAASLSPNDYRYWVPLGTALEQVGDVERGEKALRRATELAPSYAFPRWHLGNLLLRSGRYSEGFEELRRASEADPALRSHLLNLAWEVYKEDLESLAAAVGSSPEARAELAAYLTRRHKFEDGILLWQGLSQLEKRANRDQGEAIVSVLISANRFHQAAEIANDLVPGPTYHASVGKIVDGGFEDNLVSEEGSVFGWQVKSQQQASVSIDSNRGHGSNRGLRIIFQVRSRLDSINVGQLVLVKPNTQYEFECYVKTDKLQSGATPQIEIVDAPTGTAIATSPPAANGTTDWQRVAVNFKVGAKTEAVVLRVIRGSCGEESICPIFGTVWYDDFSFKPRG